VTVLYRLDAAAGAIAAHFGAHAGADPWSGGTITPGTFAPVITLGREEVAGPRPDGDPPRRLIPRLWGVPPPLSAGDPSRLVLTVRNPDSPFWIGNLRNSEFRCLVPASAFMVWGGTDPQTGKRRQHWFACADQPIFAFAGVWKDSEIPSCAVLTCEANARLREEGQERMPVILPPDPRAWTTWLRGDWKRAEGLMAPYSSGMMRDVTAGC
jgi:putative SOS response-associated peptidase YedK